MGTGYVRQSSADIVTGNTILPIHFNNEFNALRDAFDGTDGHSHDGTTGEGQLINLKTSVTDTLGLVNGGTNAVNAADARTNLGVAIGTNVQAQNAALQSIAGLTTSANQMIYTTAANSYATTALTAFVRTLLDDADATTFKTTLALQNVNNTTDANKPVSTATQNALNLKANLSSPALTGTPTTPTAAAGTNTTQIASTEFTTVAVTAHASRTDNPHTTTKAQVGLGNVDNTSDASKRTADNLVYPRLDGANAGPLGGFRNKLLNYNGDINLRSYVSGTNTTAANQYTIDRWRIVTSGQNLSWTTAANGVRTFTAPAGGVEQVIEVINLEAGGYVISWTGTATVTVGGTAVANGGQVTINGEGNVVVRFTGGTFSLPQLERGTIQTTPERRPIQIEQLLCARYCHLFDVTAAGAYSVANNGARAQSTTMFPVQMRVQPTIISGTVITADNLSNGSITAAPNARAVFYTVTQGANVGNFGGYIRDSRAEAEL